MKLLVRLHKPSRARARWNPLHLFRPATASNSNIDTSKASQASQSSHASDGMACVIFGMAWRRSCRYRKNLPSQKRHQATVGRFILELWGTSRSELSEPSLVLILMKIVVRRYSTPSPGEYPQVRYPGSFLVGCE